MRATKTYTMEEIRSHLSTAERIGSSYWRHGQHITFLFLDDSDGYYYSVGLDVHHTDGIQFYTDEVQCTRMAAYEKTVLAWRPWEE